MKKVIITAAFLLAFFLGFSQVRTPAASPKAIVEQYVGLTDVKLEYSRPGVKDRNVFGDLVPFGKPWRTGANENTIITFGDDVTIDGKKLPHGEYALYTIPKADKWDVIFYKTTDNWGTPEKWDDSKVVLKTSVAPKMLVDRVETLTIGINNLDNDSGHLEIMWDKTLIDVKFEVPTQKIANESITKTLAGPSADSYYNAANYYYLSNGDLNKALTWVNKAIELKGNDDAYWYLRLKSLIHAKLGDKKSALEAAKRSLASAEKANNADYIKMNKDSISEWKK